MKNGVIVKALSGLAFLFVTASAHSADSAAVFKVAFVDLQESLQSVDAGKQAKSQLEKEMTAKRAAIEKSQAALQKETEEFDKKAAIMNEAARSAKQAELQKKIAEFQKGFQESQVELQKRERELTKPIIDELRTIVEGLGKAQNFHLVLEKNEGAVLYAQNGTDLTKEVIEAFNSRKKGKKK
jgi:outer membrane protein